jgi:hypothetical protein
VNQPLKALPDNYVSANTSYHGGVYSKSIDLYKDFLDSCKKTECDTAKRLFAIDMLGTIYIRHMNDPDSLITYYESYKKGIKLNDAVADEIDDWIGASQDYKSIKSLANKVSGAEKLIELGNKYFKIGQEKKKYPMDRRGNPYLSIASSYYLQYIYKFDSQKRIDQALLRMGIIRSTLWQDKNLWTQNHYLKETIRRFPGTTIAKEAYQTLELELKASYTGSGGDFTPPSQVILLKYFKEIANGKFEKQKIKAKKLH